MHQTAPVESHNLSVDPECSPELTAMLGSAIAVAVSDIPFDGPCATTQVGLIDGEFIINPNDTQNAVSDLKLTVASTREKVIMIEAGANEIPEETMIEAIYKAHEVNQQVIISRPSGLLWSFKIIFLTVFFSY